METAPDSPAAEQSPKDGQTTRFGKFIQTYHTFLSSFVIGAAGLVATSIWQCRQADIASRQATAQQKVASTQADNNWKIEKAEILAKNLQVLAQGSGKAEERYGVLLSLTRGNILDPELTLSYALDLGKESPEYMRSVLASIENKDYWRLARAFEPTCEQRYGVTRPIDLCRVDKLADRSTAIAEMIADEMQSAVAQGKGGPLLLLQDEHQAQIHATRLTWLFFPSLVGFYERRQWNEIQRFESFSPGAKLIASLVLSRSQTGELVTAAEAAKLRQFHSDHRQWLSNYLLGNSCDGECKGKLVEVMLTEYEEAEGNFDVPMRNLLEQPRAVSGRAVSYLHSRLLWCQFDQKDVALLRDRVLIPASADLLTKDKTSSETLEDLLGLLALTDIPSDEAARDAWNKLLGQLQASQHSRYAKLLSEKRSAAARERASPPPAMKKFNFCGIPEGGSRVADETKDQPKTALPPRGRATPIKQAPAEGHVSERSR